MTGLPRVWSQLAHLRSTTGADGMHVSRRKVARGKQTVTLLAIAAMAFLALLGCDPDRAEAVRLYNQGMSAFNEGNTGEAARLMEQALEQDPTFTDASFTVGQLYHQRLGRLDDAARSFRRALDHEPDNPQFAYRLGSVLSAQENYGEAITYFERAISHEPDFARAWFEKGLAQNADGQFVEAVDSYMRAIEISPRLRMDEEDIGGEHYHALGDLYLRFRLYDHAARVYENGVRNNPDSPRLHHGYGVALMELERYDEAIEAFEATLERDPRHGPANYNIAVAFNGAGQLDAAVEQLESLTTGGGIGMTGPRLEAARALLEQLKEDKARAEE